VAGRQVDVGDAGAVGGELREIGAHAAANLEQLLTRVPIELHHPRHPRRVFAVAMPFASRNHSFVCAGASTT